MWGGVGGVVGMQTRVYFLFLTCLLELLSGNIHFAIDLQHATSTWVFGLSVPQKPRPKLDFLISWFLLTGLC